MSQVLYRKYRAQNFDELIGQDHISTILKNAVKKGSLSHAYLFTGSRGTGKTSTARILVKAINCQDPQDGNPCCKCENCIAITSGRFMDLIEIDAASNRGIDQIRDLKEKIEFNPVEGKYKVYIIDEVHMLTSEAFNALLKTLEEPPMHVIFILATTDAHKLPPTILSRTQRYDFRLGSDEEIGLLLKGIAKKEKISISADGVDILVHNAKGSFRDALSLLDVVYSGQIDSEKPDEISANEIRDVLGIPDSTMVYYLLEKIVLNDKVAALQMVEEIDKKGVNLQQFVKYTLYMLKDILVQKMKEKLNLEEYSFAQKLSISDVVKLINAFLVVERNLKSSSIPVLELEVLIGEMGDSANIDENPTEKIVEKKSKMERKTEEPVDQEVVKIENLKKKIEVKNTKKEKQDEDCKKDIRNKANGIDLEEIKKNWKKLTKKIQPANGHLFAFLERVNLLDFENEKLIMEVPFQFHKDRIEDPKSREAIALVCEQVYGKTFCYECIVNENIINKKPADPNMILKIDKKVDEKDNNEIKKPKNVEDIFSDM